MFEQIAIDFVLLVPIALANSIMPDRYAAMASVLMFSGAGDCDVCAYAQKPSSDSH
jgi:hypothetical protein